jgi:hypothetical protein
MPPSYATTIPSLTPSSDPEGGVFHCPDFKWRVSEFGQQPIVKEPRRSQHRHCEPTGRANARPMTGSAKQSISPSKERMDCFVASLLATTSDTIPRSRREFHARLGLLVPPSLQEGAGNAGCALHPRSRAQIGERMRARAYRLSGGIRHPLRDGFTAYAALSPVTGLCCHRHLAHTCARLDASVGASGPHGFAVRSNVVRPARPPIAHEIQPALRPRMHADALASTTSRPAFVTTRDRPSCRNETAAVSQ